MKALLCILLVNVAIVALGQKQTFKALSIGDKVPASIWKRIPRKQSTKLVILDFWSTSCESCLKAIPNIESLQKEFNDKLQMVLVNPFETKLEVNERMNKINKNRSKRLNPPFLFPSTLPLITGDTVFYSLFPVWMLPQHVWLNESGKVLYITGGYNATVTHVKKVLSGGTLTMSYKQDPVVNHRMKPIGELLSSSDSSLKVLLYSAFGKFRQNMVGGGFETDTINATVKRLFVNTPVVELYQAAFGSDKRVLLDVSSKKDYLIPDYFLDGDRIDEWNEENRFSYEICVPISEKANVNKYMQVDLNRFFGIEKGIEGLVEKRKFKAYVLIKTKDGLLKPSQTDDYLENDSLIKVTGSFVILTRQLEKRLEDMTDAERPFIDETGIDPNLKIDMKLTGDLKSVENVRKQLQQYGLDIIEAEREVEVLVIRDKKKGE